MQSNTESYADWIIATDTLKTVSDRAVAYLYIVSKTESRGATLEEIKCFFDDSGLGKQSLARLRKYLKANRDVRKIAKDTWRFSADKTVSFETKHGAYKLTNKKAQSKRNVPDTYVAKNRIKELQNISSPDFDFIRLIEMLNEVNYAWHSKNYISVILLVRAILDHVPPVFSCRNFSEVSNNYSGAKSFKEAMAHLDKMSRKIADSYLHIQIRKKESLPNDKQVNFISDIDFLLAEICRISH